MNGRILMGVGAAVAVWGVITLIRFSGAGGLVLLVIGGAIALWGARNKDGGQ